MALARVKNWIVGETLTASDLNAEFNNILNNATSLISPATAAWDMNGFELILDADADTSITADTDDQIDFRIGGADEIRMTATAISPSTSDGNALGTATLMWADLFLASGAVVNFNNGDVTMTHSANTLAFAGGVYTFDSDVVIAATTKLRLDGSASGDTYISETSANIMAFVAGNVTCGAFRDGCFALVDAVTAPTATAGFAKIFVDTSDGDLKVIFGDGTTKVIVADT
jgi:hypothetical protein